jgi:hypothetical protein
MIPPEEAVWRFESGEPGVVDDETVACDNLLDNRQGWLSTVVVEEWLLLKLGSALDEISECTDSRFVSPIT